MPKFGTKNALLWHFLPKIPYLDILRLEFKKYYRHIWNQHRQILLIAKFCKKNKIPKFGTKNALFGYFWGRIIKKDYSHIWNQHLEISIIAKFCEETKIPIFGTKNALFRYFWGRILKSHNHIWSQHPGLNRIAKFCQETKMPKFGTKNALFGHCFTKNTWLGYFFAWI